VRIVGGGQPGEHVPDRHLALAERHQPPLPAATTGSPAAARVRLTWARRAAGMAGSMSSPSMSRSSMPE